MNTELGSGERTLADETVNLFRGWESVGGRIYVTNRRVIFESHGLNIQRRNTEIPLEEVVEARRRNTLFIIPNGLEIETREGKRYRFVVWTRARLIDMIAVCKGGKLWERDERPNQRGGAPPADPSIQPGSSVEGTARERRQGE